MEEKQHDTIEGIDHLSYEEMIQLAKNGGCYYDRSRRRYHLLRLYVQFMYRDRRGTLRVFNTSTISDPRKAIALAQKEYGMVALVGKVTLEVLRVSPQRRPGIDPIHRPASIPISSLRDPNR